MHGHRTSGNDSFLPASLIAALVLPLFMAAGLDAVTLVDRGEARAVVVTADHPAEMARYAAEELVGHIEKASGARLAVVTESEAAQLTGQRLHRVYVGVTRAARAAGMPIEALADDAFLLKVVGTDLFVTGPADGARPMSEEPQSQSGTLFGVYELLQEVVGVRWLWPGELGTFVPRQATIRVDPGLDRRVAPAYAYRLFNSAAVQRAALHYDRNNGSLFYGRLSFSEEGMEHYSRDLHIYKRRHRLGQTEKRPGVGHMFTDWWARYGQEHPEWFSMSPEGKRGPWAQAPTAFQLRHVGLCFTHPDLQRHIIHDFWPGGVMFSLGDVDTRTFCQCPDCTALDGPQPEHPPAFASTLYRPWVTDRYVKLWRHYRRLAAERNPDVLFKTYLYWNYLPAPSEPVDLSEGFYAEFVPWGQDAIAYWPMSAEAEQWLRDQWQGWHETGIRLAYRPNYLHGGYVMPHLSTRQAGAFLQFATEHGMEGFDQDSLYGQWATKGPMFYVHMRLAVDPALSIDAIRREYFAAFGPADGLVERYFDYWEEYSARRPGNSLFAPVSAHIAFPASVFNPAEKLLPQALAAAENSEVLEYAERVRFLQLGLEHAVLAANLTSKLNYGRLPHNNPRRLNEARQAVEELRRFRREHEATYFSDLRAASWQELRYIPLGELFDIELNPDAASRYQSLIPMDRWAFRKDEENRGVREKWFLARSADGDGAWQAVQVPGYWSGQAHIGDYQGYGWYRFEFTIPPQWQHERLVLYCEAVDEQAWIYLNGELIGEHTVTSEKLDIGGLWNKPFEVSLPVDKLDAQRRNVLHIRVHNQVGEGGIWGEVNITAAQDLN